MKKSIKFINVFLLIISLFLLTSCTINNKKEKEVTFDFDKEYFVGIQEHFYELRNMEPSLTTDFICDMVKALGMKVFRLNVTMETLFYVDVNDTVKFNQSTKNQMRVIVDGLKEAGVERIVYSTDTFIFPYGYKSTHSKAVPNPYTEKDAYIRFLKVNSIGYGMIAEEFPEIQYFEQINEPDVPNNEVICKNGMMWGSKQQEFMYSAEDEANICVDLCYYCRQEIRKVNPENKMMTPAYTSLASCLDYLEYSYQAIESGCHPTGDDLPCSVDPDDYFDILVFHPYAKVVTIVDAEASKENNVYLITDAYKQGCDKFYEVCCKHGDSEKPHWYTEIGYSDYGDTTRRDIIGRETLKQLQMIDEELPYVECVIYYVLTDLYEFNVDASENHFGIFTAVADPDEPLAMKPEAKAIYSFMHDGSEDYSAIDLVREKYCK